VKVEVSAELFIAVVGLKSEVRFVPAQVPKHMSSTYDIN
jgi:hypothetical protein